MEKIQHFNIVAMIDGGGATSFYPIQDILEKMTVEKIGRYVTLGDVKKQFGKTLICVTHNLTKDCVEYLHPETHPDLPCLTALRMSANLPLVFEKFKYMGNFYIDGGISDNFAIQLADRPENIVELIRTKKRVELKEAVNKVISCDEDKEREKWVEIRDELTSQLSELDRRYEEAKISERKVFGCLVQPESANFNEPDDSILEYIYRLMFIPIHQAINYKIRNCSQERCTIFKLSFAGLKFFNFNIAPSTKLNMFSKGYSIVKSRFEGEN